MSKAGENETVAKVLDDFAYLITLGNIGPNVANDIKNRIEAAHKREIKMYADKSCPYSLPEGECQVQHNFRNENKKTKREIAELTEIINTECRKCGECAKFGKDCDAGDVDGAEDRRACEKFVSKEVAELRECLKEAVDLHCGRLTCEKGVCFYTECGKENECVAFKWRKALEGLNDGKKAD